jgi:hypothetical protein
MSMTNSIQRLQNNPPVLSVSKTLQQCRVRKGPMRELKEKPYSIRFSVIRSTEDVRLFTSQLSCCRRPVSKTLSDAECDGIK